MIRAAPASVRADAGPCVQLLEEIVGGELDRLLAPLRGAGAAGDEARSMDSPEVAEHEGVTSLCLVGRADRLAEMPRAVLVPRMPLEECVLVGGRRLGLVPLGVEDVLPRLDQRSCLRNGIVVQGV